MQQQQLDELLGLAARAATTLARAVSKEKNISGIMQRVTPNLTRSIRTGMRQQRMFHDPSAARQRGLVGMETRGYSDIAGIGRGIGLYAKDVRNRMKYLPQTRLRMKQAKVAQAPSKVQAAAAAERKAENLRYITSPHAERRSTIASNTTSLGLRASGRSVTDPQQRLQLAQAMRKKREARNLLMQRKPGMTHSQATGTIEKGISAIGSGKMVTAKQRYKNLYPTPTKPINFAGAAGYQTENKNLERVRNVLAPWSRKTGVKFDVTGQRSPHQTIARVGAKRARLLQRLYGEQPRIGTQIDTKG